MKRMPHLSIAARRQLARGTSVELEHTRSRRLARVIAAHHLSESPRYYVELAKMEKKLLRNPDISEVTYKQVRMYLDDAAHYACTWKRMGFKQLGTAEITDRIDQKIHYLYVWESPPTDADESDVIWFLTLQQGIDYCIVGNSQTGGGWLIRYANGSLHEKAAAIDRSRRYRGLYQAVLEALKKITGAVIYGDYMQSAACYGAWEKLSERMPDRVTMKGRVWKYNPAPHVPVMSYGAAHRWEAMAKAQGVSAVARSPRGFMRAYERAGTWARLDPWWKNRRNAFVARHMAQVRQNNEKLWKQDKSGNLRPSRRCLALICWAYMPRKS